MEEMRKAKEVIGVIVMELVERVTEKESLGEEREETECGKTRLNGMNGGNCLSLMVQRDIVQYFNDKVRLISDEKRGNREWGQPIKTCLNENAIEPDSNQMTLSEVISDSDVSVKVYTESDTNQILECEILSNSNQKVKSDAEIDSNQMLESNSNQKSKRNPESGSNQIETENTNPKSDLNQIQTQKRNPVSDLNQTKTQKRSSISDPRSTRSPHPILTNQIPSKPSKHPIKHPQISPSPKPKTQTHHRSESLSNHTKPTQTFTPKRTVPAKDKYAKILPRYMDYTASPNFYQSMQAQHQRRKELEEKNSARSQQRQQSIRQLLEQRKKAYHEQQAEEIRRGRDLHEYKESVRRNDMLKAVRGRKSAKAMESEEKSLT